MRLHRLAETSAAVRATRSRKRKTQLLAATIRDLAENEVLAAMGMLGGQLRQGRVGVGYAAVGKVRRQATVAAEPSLSIVAVDEALTAIAAESGPGSGKRREERLGALLSAATAVEQELLAGLLVGEVRQGALEAVVIEALAAAHELDAAVVRRAVMLSGDLGAVAMAARTSAAAVAAFELELFVPVQPMLASPAEDIESTLAELSEVSLEYKLDGARVQVHKQGDRVEVYSRKLHRVTAAVPEVVEAARQLTVEDAVLDGETIALRDDGSPHPFQVTMRRFGRRLDVEAMRRELPLSVRLFDVLRAGGRTLIDEPTEARWAALSELTPAGLLIPRLRTADPDAAEAFYAQALAEGHEGVMAKALDVPYEAGRRGRGWRKLKVAHTLDLVVLAAEWGSGRREGWLSNLHLGARDPTDGSFVMLGKTFKGLTDERLAWQTRALLARELGRDGHVVHVRPELVVEIAFNDVQTSPQYPGGVALRFARVKRYREDKTAAEADTIDAVRRIHMP